MAKIHYEYGHKIERIYKLCLVSSEEVKEPITTTYCTYKYINDLLKDMEYKHLFENAWFKYKDGLIELDNAPYMYREKNGHKSGHQAYLYYTVCWVDLVG